ncbi:unnamed protein product [marine sediment metagenome]|uniref:Pyruvate kinase C-terminal domain-containing protein n=1 Tax=marine sediment metagenome TaxID=412755 RepID=X1K8K0_9ZZZZ
MKYEVFYWDKPGKQNTNKTINLALKRARQLKIKNFIIASCSGKTTKKLLKMKKNIRIISVTHQAGFYKPGTIEMDKKTKKILEGNGVIVYTGTHFFGGIGRAMRLKFGGLEAEELVANTLRIFGQGVKVAVEITIMALDAGLIPYNKEIVSIGGTGIGADTAIVCLPKHGKDFFSFEVREIICKPRVNK